MKNSIKHVAIIMDGNGRWAKQKFRPRVWGHIRGSSIVSQIVKESSDLNLSALTLYAFSTENWSRPEQEITTLFKLLKKFLLKEKPKLIANKINFKVIGDISHLNQETQDIITAVEAETASFNGLKLSFAFSYGGRKEIVDAVNDHIKNHPGAPITEEIISQNMYRPEIGDVDLMIRTAGDQRISNFLLWEVSYAELFFTNTKWPDFTPQEFRQIVQSVAQRDRRFGSLDNQGSLSKSKEMAQNRLE